MIRRGEAVSHRTTWGDVAVDGLVAGAVGAIAMILLLLAAGLTNGEAPAAMLQRFAPEGTSPVTGLMMHLAVSCVYGVLFALLWNGFLRRLRVPVVAGGIAFGLLLWLLATLLLLPLSGSAFQAVAPAWFAVAHIGYGFTVGVTLRRIWASA